MEDLELDLPFKLPPITDEELVDKLVEKQIKWHKVCRTKCEKRQQDVNLNAQIHQMLSLQDL